MIIALAVTLTETVFWLYYIVLLVSIKFSRKLYHHPCLFAEITSVACEEFAKVMAKKPESSESRPKKVQGTRKIERTALHLL